MGRGANLFTVTDDDVSPTAFGAAVHEVNKVAQILRAETLGGLVDDHDRGSLQVEGGVHEALLFASG